MTLIKLPAAKTTHIDAHLSDKERRTRLSGECGVRSAECGVRSVENTECGRRGVWKMRSVENEECRKCGV